MRRYKRHFPRPTSRMITPEIIAEVVRAHPKSEDALVYLQARTGSTEAQARIALLRELNRHHLRYHPHSDCLEVRIA